MFGGDFRAGICRPGNYQPNNCLLRNCELRNCELRNCELRNCLPRYFRLILTKPLQIQIAESASHFYIGNKAFDRVAGATVGPCLPLMFVAVFV